MPRKKIDVSKGHADPKSQKLDKKQGDEAEWVSTDGQSHLVEFRGESPFTNGKTFPVPAGGSASSGPIDPKITQRKTYKYFVDGVDPDVEILP